MGQAVLLLLPAISTWPASRRRSAWRRRYWIGRRAGSAFLVGRGGPVAKRDCGPASWWTASAGTRCNGWASDAASAAEERLVPLGLAEGARVRRDVPAGTLLQARMTSR